MSIRRQLFDSVVRTLQFVLFLSVCAIVAGCSATAPDLTPISDPTQRFEFEGFSILPPRAKGWNRLIGMEQRGPKTVPNVPVRALYAVRAYFIKSLSEETTSPSDLHRLTAVVRTLNVDDLKVEDSVGFLKEMADGFSGETFLDKCFEQDCMRYQSTSEVQNPKFPNSVFVISKHGLVATHPTFSKLFINLEFRQYYRQGVQPLSAGALEKEVEPFQNSLVFTPAFAAYATTNKTFIEIKETEQVWEFGKLKYEVSPGDILEVIETKTCRSGSGTCWKVRNIKTGEVGYVFTERMKKRHHVYESPAQK